MGWLLIGGFILITLAFGWAMPESEIEELRKRLRK